MRINNDIQDLQKLLELRDVEISALRREIGRRNAEIDKLKTDICRLLDALVGIIDNDGHYPANAPLRKVIAEARGT